MQSLQERYAPHSICFGCGPTNVQGLRIRSFVEGESLVCDWQPQPHHEAFPNCLNGGITGALLDCHSNWCAAWHLMKLQGLERPPCSVTASFAVKLRHPIPTSAPVHLVATLVKAEGDRAEIASHLEAGGQICATCSGLFVAVGPTHPAFHRWD